MDEPHSAGNRLTHTRPSDTRTSHYHPPASVAMVMAAVAAAGRGFAYSIRGGLYLSLTNETNSVSLIESRGPGFTMPKSSGFALLDDGVEPTGASALTVP